MRGLPPVIVVGGESNALSIARRLSAMGVAVFGMGLVPYVRYSRYLRTIPVPPGPPGDPVSSPERALLGALLGPATASLRGAVVLAASDVGVTVLARHRDALREHYLLDVSEPVAQLDMLDKLATYQHAADAGVPTPRFWRIDGPDDLDRVRPELVFPLIVKPVHSHAYQAAFPGSSKFRVVTDPAGLTEAYRALVDAGLAVLLVEKIEGPDDLLCSYNTYIDRDGRPTFDLTKRILRRNPPNMGIACYHVTDRNPAVREVALRLFTHVGLRGVANAEFKLDVRDGQLKLIECNARFTAATNLFVSAGLDLPRHVYLQALGRPEPLPSTYRTGVRLLYPSNDVRSFRALRAAGELDTGTWLRSLAHRQTFPFWSLDDPGPAIARATQRLYRGATRAAAGAPGVRRRASA